MDLSNQLLGDSVPRPHGFWASKPPKTRPKPLRTRAGCHSPDWPQ